MSTQIDERVVEMRFDNEQFERNVNTSISSLDKLKQSLNLGGAAKGLENINAASKNVDFNSMSKSLDGVSHKFSVLETVATGALLRIGGVVTDLGLKLANTMTSMSGYSFENIAAGWEKFGQKTTAVGTLVSQGYALEKVNAQLERLNWFSDETSYNFTDMVSNISKFTATGQDLEESVQAMEGIANWAALSGQNAMVASRAMYQLSQAMGKGVLKYDDWRSIQNASMDTVEFRKNAVDAALALNQLKRVGEDAFTTLEGHTFTLAELFTSDALSRDGWFNADVMMSTFNKYSGAVEQIYNYAKRNNITASEAIEALGDSIDEFGLKAFKAAQEARTWADVVDSVKDAVSSGWSTTFEMIIGDYNEAKTLWTNMANDLYDIFAEGGNQRNELLFEALSTPYQKFSREVANFVDEMSGLSDAELEAKGYTRAQYEEMVRLNEQLKSGSEAAKDYIDSISAPSGRENLAQSLYNLHDALFLVDKETKKAIGVIAVVKEAWSEVFPPMTAEKIYHMTEVLRDFTESLIPSEERADQLRRTFKGLFSVLDIAKQAFVAVLRAVKPLFGGMSDLDGGIFKLTASFGDWLSSVADALREHDVFYKVLDNLVGLIKRVVNAVRGGVAEVNKQLGLPSLGEFAQSLTDIFNAIQGGFDEEGMKVLSDFIGRVKEMDGLTLDNISAAITDFRENVLGHFLGSGDEMTGLGISLNKFTGSINAGFTNITNLADNAKDHVADSATSIAETLGKMRDKIFAVALDIRSRLADKIGFAEIFAIGLGTAMVSFTKKIADAFMLIASPFEGIEKLLKGCQKALNGFATKLKSEALLNAAKAILMLVGALTVLALLDKAGMLTNAVWVLTGIAAALVTLTVVMSKLSTSKEVVLSSSTLLAFSVSILTLAAAMKKLAGLDLGSSVASLVMIETLMWSMLAITKLMSAKEKVFSTGATAMIAFAVSLQLMVGVIKSINKLHVEDPGKVITVLIGMIAGMAALALASRNVKFTAGAGILAMVVSLKLLVGSLEDLGSMDVDQLKRGLTAFTEIFAVFALVTAATKLAGEHASKAGTSVLKMSAALMLIVETFKMMEGLDPEKLKRSEDVITEMLTVFALVTAASKFAGENASKAGTMLLAMSGALLVLTVTMTILSHLAESRPEGLDRALAAVTQMLLIFGTLTAITRLAGDASKIQGTLVILTVAIATLTASVTALALLKPEGLKGATTALSMIIGAFSLLVAASYLAKGANKEIWSLVGVMTAIGVVLTALGALPVQASVQSAEAIGIVLTALSASMLILSKSGALSKDTVVSALALVGIVTAIGAVLTGLSAIPNTQASIQTATAIGIVLTALSASMLALSVSGDIAWQTVGQMAALTGVVAGIGVILSAMAKWNAEASIQNAASISLVLTALSASMLILSVAGPLAEGTMGAMTALLAITAGIATILGLMAKWNAEASIQSATAVGIVLGSLSASLVILSKAGAVTPSSLVAMGALVAVALGIAGLLKIMDAWDVEPSIKTATALSILLVSMSAACVLLSAAGATGAAGFIGVGVLVTLVAAIGGLMAAISALTRDNPTVEEDLDRAIMVMEKIGTGLGSAIGGFVGGLVGSGISTLLAEVGQGLADFMTNAEPFFSGLKNISPDMLGAVASLTGVCLALAATEFVSSIPIIGSLFSGASSFDTFATQLNSLGDAMKSFATNCNLSDADIEQIKKSADAAQALADLANSVPKTGTLITFFGGHDIGVFGDQLIKFGEGLKSYSASIAGDPAINVDAIKNSAKASEALVKLANTVPKTGTLVTFLGGNDIGAFGTQLIAFGNGLKQYSASVSGENAIQQDAIETSVKASEALVKLSGTVPKTGALISFFGGTDIGEFGNQIASFGSGLKGYSDSVANLNIGAIDNSVTAAQSLVELTGIVPETSAFSASAGQKLASFVNSMVAYPKAMQSYATAASGLSSYMADITASAEVGAALTKLSTMLGAIGSVKDYFDANTDFTTFTTGITSFGRAMRAYGVAVSGLDKTSGSVQASAAAGEALAALNALLPNLTAVMEYFQGDHDFDAFASGIIPFGQAIVQYASTVDGVDASAVTISVAAVESLAELQGVLSPLGELRDFFAESGSFEAFIAGIVTFGEGVKTYSGSVDGINATAVGESVSAVRALAEIQNDLPQLREVLAFFGEESSGGAFAAFGAQLAAFCEQVQSTNTDKLARVIVQLGNISKLDGSKMPEFSKSLKSMADDGIKKFVQAFSESKQKVTTAVKDLISSAITAMRACQNQFYEAGRYHVQGFLNGINSRKSEVAAAGTALGNTLARATRDTLGIHSPGDEGYNQMKFHVQGMLNGATDSLPALANAGKTIGSTVMNSVTDGLTGDGTGGDITGLLTDMLNKAGANTSNVNFDWLNGATTALNEEAAAANNAASSYNNATSAKNAYTNATKEQTKALEELNKVYYTGYANKEYDYMVANLGEGLAIGFANGSVKQEDAVSKSIDEVMKIAAKGIDAWKDWADNQKYYNQLSLKDELAGWQELQKAYAAGTKERQEIDRELYRVEQELIEATYQFSMDWIEKEKYYNRLSLEEELAAYERMQSRYASGSKQRIELDKLIYSTKQKLIDETYQKELDYLEEEKYYGRTTLLSELSYYRKMQTTYANDTEKRKKIDREVYRLEKEIYEAQKQYTADVQRVQEEAAQKKLDLEEQYADKVTSINEKLASDIKNLNDQYENSLNSRANSLYQSYGLFDEVKEREEVSGSTLLNNLQGQVEEFTEWQRTLDKLSARGVDSELIKELSQMGPSAISQIKALESMTDSELNRYVGLWQVKHALARQQALSELQDLRVETENNIVQLRADAERELEAYRVTWQQKMQQVDIDANKELDQLRQDYQKKVGLIRSDVEKETAEMVKTVNQLLKEAGWEETGEEIVKGLEKGVEKQRPNLLKKMVELAKNIKEVFCKEVDIHSPSKDFEEYGGYIGEGLVIGINAYAMKAALASARLGEKAKEGLSDAIVSINDYLSGDVEAQPTIRPVLDLSDVAAGADEIDNLFYNRRLMALAGQTSLAFAANTGDNELTVNVDNDGVVQELRTLRGEMAEMAERMAHLQVILDSGTLVGETAPLMDAALGQRQTFRGRGN